MCEPTPGLTHLILSEIVVLLFVLVMILVVLVIVLILVVILILVLIIILVVFILIVAHKNTSLSYIKHLHKKRKYTNGKIFFGNKKADFK